MALFSNTADNGSIAVGTGALSSNTADNNSAVGFHALFSNTTGGTLGTTQGLTVGPNTALGTLALGSNTIASANTAVGYQALGSMTTGDSGTNLGLSTAVGFQALANATGASNSAFGYHALFHNTTGFSNVAIGVQAPENNIGSANTAVGTAALLENTSGIFNTAVGDQALQVNTTGNNNIALGTFAGQVTTGSDNIVIGNQGSSLDSGTIRIGRAAHTRTFIAAIRGVTTGNNNGIPVLIDSGGQLGTVSSSRRFKREIKPIDKASEAILALKPVTFHYKSDKTNRPEFGLIAEEVAEVNPNLVVRDEKGDIYTVRYEAVNAMLLNEFLKEHRKNQEQEKTIARQQKQIEALAAGLQKVSVQLAAASPSRGGLEASKFAIGRIRGGGPAPQVVNTP